MGSAASISKDKVVDTAKEFFGDKLVKHGGEEVSIEDAIADKKAIALYFSAHWCPPCRGFTPQLAEIYNNNLKEKGMEVVFVSSDSNEESFNEYLSEMPWLALPFELRGKKKQLTAKYGVRGIPTLIIVDPTDLSVIAENGRSKVLSDRTGENFPWKPAPKGPVEKAKEFFGDKLLKSGGEEVSIEDALADKKAVALYFSAHWCGPCRGFTPQLAEAYTNSLKDKGMEVIFVSCDSSDDGFNAYFSEMPWLALPFSERGKESDLCSKYGISGIPSLIILDAADLSILTKNGRSEVMRDKAGDRFPWRSEQCIGPGCETPRDLPVHDGPEPAILMKADPKSSGVTRLEGGARWEGSAGKTLVLPDESACAAPGWDICPDMSKNFAVEATVKLDEWPEKHWQGSLVSAHGNATGWELRCGGKGIVAVFTTTIGGHNEHFMDVTTDKVDKWHHFCMAYNAEAKTMTLFVDGVASEPKSIKGSFKPLRGKGAEVGRNPAWNDRGIVGMMRDVAVWPQGIEGGTEDMPARAAKMIEAAECRLEK